jgi:hypothetical protein
VPCIHTNTSTIFTTIMNNIDKMLLIFNNSYSKYLLYNKPKEKDTQTNNSIDIPTCLEMNCVLNKIRYKNRNTNNQLNTNSNFNNKILYNTNNFRFKLFTHMKNHSFKVQPNLNYYQIQVIKDFKNKKPFKIVELDKNLGSAFISHDLYNNLIDKHLNDLNIYAKLDNDPLFLTTKKINDTLEFLRDSKSITNRLFQVLIPKNVQLGKFRLLPKIHKKKFDCRPIVNCRNTPTSNLALFLELILRKFVEDSQSYIKDSADLIRQCEDLHIDSSCHAYSCDFSALYTNIPSNECLILITQFLKKQLHLFPKDFDLIAIHNILKLVLFNNIFSSNNKFYIQIKGISMGIICGPTIANLYLSILEKQLLVIEKPLIYKRYIDDILIITKNSINSDFFKRYFPNLEISINEDNEIVFLDLKIKIDKILNSLNFALFTKPFIKPSYLRTESNHPIHIQKNIPKSQFIRIRRLCTSLTDFIYYSRSSFFQFMEIGYNYKQLQDTFRLVYSLNRNDLLKEKSKQSNDFNKNLLIKYYHCNTHNRFSANFNKIWSSIEPSIPLKVVNCIDSNLKSLLIFNGKLSNQFYRYKLNKKCLKINCKSCIYLNLTNDCFKDYFNVPIIDNCDCNSSNIIYLISCKQCNVHYVGESSKSAEFRLRQHLNNIKHHRDFGNFKSVVSAHFNNGQHDLNNLHKFMCFSILRKDLLDKITRKHLESDLINILLIFNIKLMNDTSTIINYKFIKHYYFNF